MPKITLYGFDGSTYVRTVKMLLAEKGCTAFEQVQVNVLAGEPHSPEHLERHPFGKVPALDYDGLRLIETSAITRFLNDKLPGKSLVPATPEDRARMDMVMGLVDSYGYGGLVGGVAAYHLFPDLVGGQNEQSRRKGIETGRQVLGYAMRLRGGSDWVAGELSLADLYLAPILFYVSLTPDKGAVFDVPGLSEWWERVGGLSSYRSTEPKFG